MKHKNSEKYSALLIVVAALFGFVAANSALAPLLDAFRNAEISGSFIQFTLDDWVSEFGLAFFFLLVGIELKNEFTHGHLKPLRNSLSPLLGAVLGVVIPGLVFILIVGLHSSAARGWVIPTATDVAFALVIFTLFGKHLSRRARSFLLTFAVIDDLIAMILIALLFTQSINLFSLTLSLAGMIVFAYLIRRPNVLAKYAASVAAMFVWYEIGNSGIHPTLAGLLIGFLVPKHLSNAVESALRPWVSFAALPLFALFATAIELPEFNSIPIALFVAIAIRPLTKWIGISTGALIGNQLTSKNNRMRNSEILRVASLGGIGFTVSLLVAQLSLTDQNQKAAAGLATLMSAFISMAVGAVVLIAGHRTKSAHSS